MTDFFKLHGNVQLRIVIMFYSTLVSNMVFPFMAIYFATRAGLAQTSLILSGSIVANLLAGILGGYISDRIGRRKVMLFAEGLRLLTYAGLFLSSLPKAELFGLIVGFFMLNSVCSGIYGPASEAMLLDVTSKEERKFMYSVLYWVTNVSIALGGTIGALLFKQHLPWLFGLLMVSAFCSILLTGFLLKETNGGPAAGKDDGQRLQGRSIFANYGMVLKDRVFVLFVASSMLLFSVESHLTNFIAIRFETNAKPYTLAPFDWHLDGIQLFGYLRTENTILVIVLSIILTGFIKKLPDKISMFAGFVLFVTGYVALSIGNQPWLLFGVMALAVLGEVLFVPIYETYMGDLTPADRRASYLAFHKFANKGAALIGTVSVYLYNVLPPAGLTAFVAATGFLPILVLFLLLPSIEARKEAQLPQVTGKGVAM